MSNSTNSCSDPFQIYCKEFIKVLQSDNASFQAQETEVSEFEVNYSSPFLEAQALPWTILACHMVLKDKRNEIFVHQRALAAILLILRTKYVDITDEHTRNILLHATRRAMKRLGVAIKQELNWIVQFVNDKIEDFDIDMMLLFVVTLKDYDYDCVFENNDQLKGYVTFVEDCFCKYSRIQNVKEEFWFIKTEEYYERTLLQRIQRHLSMIDPIKMISVNPFERLFDLFSLNDSDLITFLLRLQDKGIFEFYRWIIENDLLSIDFFINQLLTDSPKLLELLLKVCHHYRTVVEAIETKCRAKEGIRISFIQFHTLLALKIESTTTESFPFNPKPLLKALHAMINKLKESIQKNFKK